VPVNIALRRVWKYNFPALSSSTSITFSTKMPQRITTLSPTRAMAAYFF